jgi:hypothetical protein
MGRPGQRRRTHRERKLERKLKKPGKEYGYAGSTVDRWTFIELITKEAVSRGFSRGHVELALKILEQKPRVRRITDMDVINFLEYELKPKMRGNK